MKATITGFSFAARIVVKKLDPKQPSGFKNKTHKKPHRNYQKPTLYLSFEKFTKKLEIKLAGHLWS